MRRLSLPRRLRIHLRVAQTMERLYGSTLDSHLAELAFHYRQAGTEADSETAIDYSIRAGDAAARVFAWAEAIGHYDGALEASKGERVPDPQRRCRLLLSLGEALIWAGDTSERVYGVVAPEAYDLAMTLASKEMAARAARGAVESLRMQLGSMALTRRDYREWAERLDRLAADKTVDRIYADVAMAGLASVQGRPDEAEERCLHALELAREIGAGDTVALIVFQAITAYCGRPRLDARRRQLVAEVASLLAVLPRRVSSRWPSTHWG
jgi:eukaryotic-like serine/threonine-protein kinase